MTRVLAEPSDPKKVHALWIRCNRFRPSVYNISMKYTNDASIPVCLRAIAISHGDIVIFVGQYHDICMVSWVHGILSTAYIISGIIYPHDLVPINAIPMEGKGKQFLLVKVKLITCIRMIQKATKKVCPKTGEKVLIYKHDQQ